MTHNKTKTSHYRRLYIAYLIDSGVNTVPLIAEATGMPRRTIQDVIADLGNIDIVCEFVGPRKNGNYKIIEWAAIKKQWVKNNLQHVKDVLESA